MKLLMIAIIMHATAAQAQRTIASIPLELSTHKTTNIVFAYSIRHVNLGSPDILGEIVPAADSILQLRALKEGFSATSLSVVTEDGVLHCFDLHYAADPEHLNIAMDRDSGQRQRPGLPNPASMRFTAMDILHEHPYLSRKVYSDALELRLNGIYLDQQLLWFSFDLRNLSQLEFEPGFLHVTIRDNQSARRTARQETDPDPLYQSPLHAVPPLSHQTWVMAFSSFGLSGDRSIFVELTESGNGRQVSLRIPQRVLLKARPVEPLP